MTLSASGGPRNKQEVRNIENLKNVKANNMEWIINNTEWIFSGIGVTVVSLIVGLLWKKHKSSKSTTMKQKSGNNSTNIQIGGNYNGK